MMNTTMPTKNRVLVATRNLLIGALAAAATFVATPIETAHAQQIRVTGPLAGAPAVRKLRLYRKLRLEVAPTVSFTLLDQFERQMFFGGRLNFGVTDWLSVGAWGGGAIALNTNLTNEIQTVNEDRDCNTNSNELDCKLTAVNLGDDFREQVAKMNWVVAPQITAIPFRGKLGLFNEIFVDADLYAFGGVGIIGLSERGDCDQCTSETSFDRVNRTAIAPTFGLGFTFFTNRWTAVGAEWRALPFKANNGGFDVAGGGEDDEFPDGRITSADREFHFNQMLSLSFNMYFPRQNRVSE